MPDNRFDSKKVSTSWDVVLTHARNAGVKFHLNSGRRTMNEQWALWRNFRRVGHPVAAFPSPNAPHIRVGRQAHALDVQTPGETNLQRHLEHHGLHVTNPVRGEPWHLEVPERELRALAKKLRQAKRGKR